MVRCQVVIISSNLRRSHGRPWQKPWGWPLTLWLASQLVLLMLLYREKLRWLPWLCRCVHSRPVHRRRWMGQAQCQADWTVTQGAVPGSTCSPRVRCQHRTSPRQQPLRVPRLQETPAHWPDLYLPAASQVRLWPRSLDHAWSRPSLRH